LTLSPTTAAPIRLSAQARIAVPVRVARKNTNKTPATSKAAAAASNRALSISKGPIS
jgi:hypothetical protein